MSKSTFLAIDLANNVKKYARRRCTRIEYIRGKRDFVTRGVRLI